MRSVLGGFTTRGTAFLAAGVAAFLAGLILGDGALISIGAVLFALPLLSGLAAGRARYRLSCVRAISPPRVPAGQTTRVILRLQNVSRLPTGLMLAEDTVPYALGTRPRYVLDGVERGGTRELSYPLRSDLRGKFTIGPLEVRIADAFGLIEVGRSFSSNSTLLVTPRVVRLGQAVVSGSWVGDGEGRTRTAASAGEDDVIPRAYRDGDELRRVHWRSTARYGELMVRREEQRWKNRAALLLDTRRGAHSGTGAASSFEFAVSAAASVGVHLAREGLDGRLITDSGAVVGTGQFEDALLETLSVIRMSASSDLSRGIRELSGETGMAVVIAGRITAADARALAASRHGAGSAIAILLAVSTWTDQQARPGGPAEAAAAGPPGVAAGYPEETQAAAAVLQDAGWRVISVDASTPLQVAWQRLPRIGGAGLLADTSWTPEVVA
ncbi:MAG TPA: DUF58 domain-containing protein [Streptosporangiaceae bacterium]|jgi:uncharacterized protein (DUF58 family)